MQSADKIPGFTLAFYCSSVSWGGLEMNLVRYAGWMKERGWNVIVCCVDDTPVMRQASLDELTVVPVLRNSKYLDFPNAIRVRNVFRKHNVKICWFRDTRDMSLAGLVKRFSGGRLKLLYQQAMQFGVSKRDIFHTLRFLPVDAWVSTLNFLAEQVRTQTRFPHDRIHVIPLGVDSKGLLSGSCSREEARTVLNLPADAFIAGIMGRIDRLKGQHVAIDALHLLHKKGKRHHLLVCGDSTLNEGDAYMRFLTEKIEEYGLSNYVHLRPYTKDVHLFYSAIDAFLLCSQGETFGTVTIEAMASGLPIIGTNSSGTPEILRNGDCGLLFEPGDAAGLSEHIAFLGSDTALASALAGKAKAEFNRRYSKEMSVEGMHSLLLSLSASL